jgi:hypothetical protein
MGIFTGTNGVTNSLPVILTSLVASKQGNDVIVSWNTVTEINNKGFEVERSLDGKNFKFVGFVKGAGNSNKSQTYRLNDVNAFQLNNATVLYFRLKQIDFDGKFTYSKIVSVNDNKESSNVVSVYPNPFTSDFNIQINTQQQGIVNIEIISIHGSLIATLTKEIKNGINIVPITENNSLKTGIYFVKTNINGEIKTIKLIKN